MDNYLDIRLLPDPEMPATVLMNSLFAKLHRRLVVDESLQIGVSFPALLHGSKTLGQTLRVHGSGAGLKVLMAESWIGGLLGYAQLGAAAAVPANAQAITVRRVQPNSSPEQLARRYAKRHNVTEAEAAARYESMQPKALKLPYLLLKSQSTGQGFSFFINQQVAENGEVLGGFNRYGLSQTATLPGF